jgi:hypothetical protein
MANWAPASDDMNNIASTKPMPDFIAEASLALSGTNVDGIYARTYGLRVQALALIALQEKFGKPTNLNVTKATNAYGASYDSVLASWQFKSGAVLEFQGIVGNVNFGYIVAKSANFVAAEQASRQAQAAKEVKF